MKHLYVGHTERKGVCEQSAHLEEFQQIIRHEISNILIQQLQHVSKNILSCEVSTMEGGSQASMCVPHFLHTSIPPPPPL
jgi:hypothetical protein